MHGVYESSQPREQYTKRVSTTGCRCCDRDPHYLIGPMTADKLIAFESVQVVRDYVSVNAYADDFTTLGFLKNLRTIKGQSLSREYVPQRSEVNVDLCGWSFMTIPV